ncbi:MAG: hypothetical protein HUJ26_12155 [Planctomycetaceae bacterium]|nr:hypothetical protein [Planctomycetaceae bacterium]
MHESYRRSVAIICAAVVMVVFFLLLQSSPLPQSQESHVVVDLETELPDLESYKGMSLEETIASLELTELYGPPLLTGLIVWSSSIRTSHFTSKRFPNELIEIHWRARTENKTVSNIRRFMP